MSDDVAQLLAGMRADFIAELPDRCDRLEERVLALEAGVPGAFDELFRQLHSLKGMGGTFGVSVITTICHQFESFIGESRQRLDGRAASTALSYVDLLRKAIAAQGRDVDGVAAIERSLEQLHDGAQSDRVAVLMVDPSDTVRLLYQSLSSEQHIQLAMAADGMTALGRMLHESFELLVISRELPDLNALAVVAALRESHCRNSDIPVILVSNNPAPIPSHLGIGLVLPRDSRLMATLKQHIPEILARRKTC